MAKATRQDSEDVNVSRPYKGLHTDNSFVDSPKDTYRYLLNGVDSTTEGDDNFVSNERSNASITSLPTGFYAIGNKYIGDGQCAVWSVNIESGREQIGVLDKDDVYRPVVDTNILGLRITNQIDATYRLRRSREKVVYWVDAFNDLRVFNFSKPEDFYNDTFKKYLETGGNPNTYPGEKWDASSFALIKTYQGIPAWVDAEILEYGSIASGSYNFAIQYIDEDLNPTGWITTSMPVRIFNDSTDKPYHRIRGSKNIQSDAQNFSRANKSIKLTLANLDRNFPFYRIAIIQANAATGKPERALASNPVSTSTPTYIYSGNDSSLSEIPLQDIILDPVRIDAPEHIDQLENRLIVANGKGSRYDWCEFQSYASRIKSDLVTTPVILNAVESDPNQKNANSPFLFTGFMPGEAYSFAVVYLFPGGVVSPAFHIPGKNGADTVSLMDYYDTNETYDDLHNCYDGTNHWGKDAFGQQLKARKVRHHKFPTRKDANKPLITVSDSPVAITRYKLSFTIALSGGLTSWPVDSNGDPVVIQYSVSYKPTFAATPYTITSYLTEDSLTQEIVIYNDVNPLDTVSGPNYLLFDPTSELMTTYAGDFATTESYTNSPDQVIISAVTSELFGIEFSGVEKPHPDCIGFYIVRHEREDTDRNVIDNAIIGMSLKKDQYRAFSLLMPKVEDAKKDTDSVWFWSPEHQFFKKKLNFTGIDIQGYFEETSRSLPRSVSVGGGLARYRRMLIVEDVYPGTSYNAEVHKKNNKDDDGFSLAISYRNFMVAYSSNTTGILLPVINKVFYLDACASRPDSGKTYYNVSCDNKIGFITFLTPVDTTVFHKPGDNKVSRLLYATLTVNNRDAYADFLTRPYFKCHNNPFLFTANTVNDAKVFGGDAYISPHNFVNTVFVEQRMGDFDKKDRTWQIVAGAILIVAGVIAGIFTAGAGLSISVAGVALLAGLAISYGVSLAMSGIKFEQMKSMIDSDYPKGLQDLVKDQDTMYTTTGVFDYPGPGPAYPNDGTSDVGDDSFIWHADRVSNLWVESTIPYAIRSGLTAGVPDFVDAPNPNYDEDEFRTYLTDKLTVLDKDRGSGRLYKGYPTAEFYDINPDYIRMNKEKFFYHLPMEYDCCSQDTETFPGRWWWSEQSFQEERIDNYRVFLPNNYRDIEGEFGEITDLYKQNNQLFIQTSEALWAVPHSLQERVTGQIITFIGTGGFFQIPPRRVSEDNLVSGGTTHKWATVKTRAGMISVSESDSKVNLHHSQGLKELSSEGQSTWFRENLQSFLAGQIRAKLNVPFNNDNNPANPEGIGIHAIYDTEHDRIIITKRDYLLKSDYLHNLRAIAVSALRGSLATIDPLYPISITFDTEASRFAITQVLPDGEYFYNYISLSDPVYFEDKSWTVSYSLSKQCWRSFHSYIPLHYINKPKDFYSLIDSEIWKHNIDGSFQLFYGVPYPHILEYVATSSPLTTKIWDDFCFQTIAKKYSFTDKQFYDVNDVTFTRLTAYNSRQSTPDMLLLVKDKTDEENYMFNQVHNLNPGEALLSRRERNWCVNELRDYRIDYTKPVFTTEWSKIEPFYPIDKVLNIQTITSLKDWSELEPLRDKYLVIRLTFDTFVDVSLTTNYVLETEQQSFR